MNYYKAKLKKKCGKIAEERILTVIVMNRSITGVGI